VDDEDLVRASTADMLTDLGYRVVEAQTAEEALRKIEEGLEVDLLVTDHLMPGMTGADLARAVGRNRPNLPVLLISGYAEAEGVGVAFTRLTKPFRQNELADVLVELTGNRRSA
jgi:CheY-like chemotaxis protein